MSHLIDLAALGIGIGVGIAATFLVACVGYELWYRRHGKAYRVEGPCTEVLTRTGEVIRIERGGAG